MAAYNNDRIPLSDNEKTVESFMMENPEQQDDLKAAPRETVDKYSEWQDNMKAAPGEAAEKYSEWQDNMKAAPGETAEKYSEWQDNMKAAPGETAETYPEWQGDSKAAADELGDKDGPWEKFVRLCRQNKLAVISGIVILVILVLVILAPAVAPFGEAEQDRESILQGPSLRPHIVSPTSLPQAVSISDLATLLSSVSF